MSVYNLFLYLIDSFKHVWCANREYHLTFLMCTLLTECCFSRFGYVEFDSEEDCKAAREAMDDCEINGKKVTLDYALPKRAGGQGGFRGRGRGGFVVPGRGRANFGGRGGGRGGFGGRGAGRGGRRSQISIQCSE